MDYPLAEAICQVIDTHKDAVTKFEKDGISIIIKAASVMANVFENGGRVYVCGNGGSAADAQHIAGELIGRFEMDRKALPVVALTTDTSILTAIGNDISFDDIFVRQAEALIQPNDLLWVISTSGESSNILKVSKLAKERGATVLSFTGKANSSLEQISNICLCANCLSTARSQEIHQLAYHILCGLVEHFMCNSDLHEK